jgi:hypothetical protein
MGFEIADGCFLVAAHKSAIASDVGGKNRSQLSRNPLSCRDIRHSGGNLVSFAG